MTKEEDKGADIEKMISEIKKLMPGIDSSNGLIAQSDCVIFRKDGTWAFNDSVAVRSEFTLGFDGAIPAQKLMSLLNRFKGKEEVVTEIKGNEYHLSRQDYRKDGRKAGIRKGSIKFQPEHNFMKYDIAMPTRWRPLPEDFCDAVLATSKVTGREEHKFTLTCIHITPDFVEACDNTQLIRWKTQTGFRTDVLIPNRVAMSIMKHKVVEAGLTKGWVHFRDKDGITYSARTHDDKYPDMDPFYDVKGDRITFPEKLSNLAQEVSSISSGGRDADVLMKLSEDTLVMESHSLEMSLSDTLPINYKGEPISFYIHPQICVYLSENARRTIVNATRMKVWTTEFQYVAVLQSA